MCGCCAWMFWVDVMYECCGLMLCMDVVGGCCSWMLWMDVLYICCT